jgi:hypothetical protein
VQQIPLIILSAIAFSVILGGRALQSQLAPASQQLPKPEAVFSAAAQAMGGERLLQKVESIKAIADCTGPKSTYTTEIISARPDRLFFKQSWQGREPFVALINGRYSWTRSEVSGKVSLMDKNTREIVRGHDFQMIAISPTSRFTNPVVEGYEEFAGARRLKIGANDDLGNKSSLFFNVNSYLMAGMIITNPSDTRETVKVVFNEWKQVGNIKLPSVVTATDKSGDFVLRFKEIILNQLDKNMFRVPEEIAPQTN